MRQPNTWVYTLPIEETVHISCGKDVFNQKVVGTGILSIATGCKINAFNFRNTVQEFLKMEKFTMINIINPNIVNFGQKEKLQEISMSLDEIKAMEDSLQYSYTPTEIKHRMGWLSICMILTATGILIVLGKYVIFKITKACHRYSLKQLEVTVVEENEKMEINNII